MHGQLTKDELDARAGQALAARTYADLAALTADIPPRPPAARPARPPAPVRRRPLARAAAKSGVCLIIAAAAMWVLYLLLTDDGHYHGIPGANLPMSPWFPWRFSWPLRRMHGNRHRGERGGHLAGAAALPKAAAASGRAAPPWKPSGAAAPAMVRFPLAPAPTRPRPTCGLTSHGSANGTFPPGRAGHPVA